MSQPPEVFAPPVVICPGCGHGIDPHAPGQVCGVGDVNRTPCACRWSPNDIAAYLLRRPAPGQRISQDEAMMETAEVIARRGTCSRRYVGAVLSRNGRTISSGYNGAPSGLPHCVHLDDTSCKGAVHAEVNAYAVAARHGNATDGTDLFTTCMPCLPCSQLIINAGTVRVVYRTSYRLTDGVDLLRSAGVRVEHLS